MKVPVSNETDKYMHVGGVTIPPGETREVEETHLPGYQGEEAQAVPEDDFLVELLKLAVPKIKEQLPTLNDQDLDRLGQLEQDKGADARKSLLEALSEAQLDRAALNFDTEVNAVLELPVEELLPLVSSYSTEILQRVLTVEQAKGQSANAELVKAIEDELAKEDRKA